MNKDNKALVILSGGADSTICTAWAKKTFKEVHTITFSYGQLHNREIVCAKTIGEILNVKTHEFINIEGTLKGTSPLINKDEAVQKYKDVESLPGGVEPTFVPARNLLFLTIASNRAYNLGIRDLVTGVCQADGGNYADCRQEFIDSAEDTINLSNYGIKGSYLKRLSIHTPLMYKTKAESILMAKELGIVDILKYTHSCYNGTFPPCGKCHSCLLRERGFKEAGIEDPLLKLKENI